MHRSEIDSTTSVPTPPKPLNIALLGNPNCGKSSIFNQLTGLRQKVGNFPGVTVDKKLGRLFLDDGRWITLIDFPGTYSFYPTSQDERIAVQTFSNPDDNHYPDAIIYIADVTRLEKHLLLFSQLKDLGLPIILVLNMADLADRDGIAVRTDFLAEKFDAPVVMVSGRTGKGIDELKAVIAALPETKFDDKPTYKLSNVEKRVAARIRELLPVKDDYRAKLIAHHYVWLPFLAPDKRAEIARIVAEEGFVDLRAQVEETMARYDHFTPIVQRALYKPQHRLENFTEKLDAVLTHRIAGPLIFFVIMLLVFQAIFTWATYPMDWIEGAFAALGDGVRNVLPAGWFTDFLTDGILAGLGGIVVFVPQIAILFFLITLLEEVGYMARAVFLFDRLMQAFGLNGRSIVALISGGACAIPAIMSTRTISNWKERLITILVTPLISCSARIPVYTVLIGFVVPATTVWGFFNLQGLAFMGLYLLGIAGALTSALIFKLILRTRETSFLMLELPEYRPPVMRNVWLTVWEKVKSFLLEAGKVILIISMILWVLASYGPSSDMEAAEAEALELAQARNLDETATDDLVAAKKIEASFAGQLGKLVEPVIRPLGYDWKIGIALITSFAAREVFVGTMATIYSIGSSDDEFSVRERMARERDADTGEPVYTIATSLSLLLFYVFAMQCMATLAVVRKETNSWKWPVVQFLFMTALAYLSALAAYQFLS